MRTTPVSAAGGRTRRRAAIFVDYENLYAHLNERLDRRGFADELISEMIDELRRYLVEEEETTTSVVYAYADFSALNGNGPFIQRTLYLQGCEPRFVPAELQENAVEIQLCVDAMDVLHHRAEVETFVLLTGNRSYLPLLQQVKRSGREALVAALEIPPAAVTLQQPGQELFFEAVNLLGEASRRELGESLQPKAAVRAQADYLPLDEPISRQVLEIIEEHFGQYEEVYLTPLLRKLSDLLDERRYDPKELISTLEKAGAVRLEKRKGFPYDYTVLIVDAGHPLVQEVQEAYAAAGSFDEADYDDTFEDYDDEDDEATDDAYDAYDDDFEDYEEDDYEEEPGEPTMAAS